MVVSSVPPMTSGHEMLVLGEQQRHQVRAVVHGHLRLVIHAGVQVRVIGGVVFALDRVGRNRIILDQRRGDFILRGKRIRGAQNQIGAAVAQRDGQVRRFAGHVQAQGKAHALQRLFLDESLADQLQNGHLLIGPFDFSLALFRQGHIPNIARRALQSLCHANLSCLSIVAQSTLG